MADFIRVGSDRQSFVEGASGPRFAPFGCNYFDPLTGWAPKIWSQYDRDRVRRHLGQIAGAGLNCIRVFLDMAVLNPRPDEFSEEGFAKADDLIAAARACGVRIIFSGPNTWHGRPEHRRGDPYADPGEIEFNRRLWQKIAARWGSEPAIMAWDLLNEPMVGWPTRAAGRPHDARLRLWQAFARSRGLTPGDDLLPPDTAGQDRPLWAAYLAFQEQLAEQWVERQVRALRDGGARQMITVGLIQWTVPVLLPRGMGASAFTPRRIARHLDYMSAHFYPMPRRGQDGLEPELALQQAYLEVVLRAVRQADRPLVLEEFGWKGGRAVPREGRAWPEEHQTFWGDALMAVSSRAGAAGWLNWGYADAADPKADISAASGLWTSDERLKHWGRRFAQFAARFKAEPPSYAPPARRIEVRTAEFLFAHGGHPQLDWLEGQVKDSPGASIEVVFNA
ncbi:MAG: glycoside hydrolase family 5 protein [Planctomycetes bacterium]|nr:glycoside hydrolase family 5 protein [Planctomycetota bacterium]